MNKTIAVLLAVIALEILRVGAAALPSAKTSNRAYFVVSGTFCDTPDVSLRDQCDDGVQQIILQNVGGNVKFVGIR